MNENVKKRFAAAALGLVLVLNIFTGCGSGDSDNGKIDVSDSEKSSMSGGSAAVATTLMPEASGTVTDGNSDVTIDMSNTSDGYFMVDYLTQTDKRLKLSVKGPSGTAYTYNITQIGAYETFPFSDGSGTYTIGVYQNVSGNSYSSVFSTTADVSLKDEFAPFLLPNQYVNYTKESKVVKKAAELVSGDSTDLERIQSIYTWVVENVTYDTEKAATVESGYLPDVDEILESKKGICFDYAALMASMLRSQDIPCKLVVGYAGTAYHAWIDAYTSETGWVNNVIYFDGNEWKLMDPTFASSGNESEEVMEYIGDGSNYTEKYLY